MTFSEIKNVIKWHLDYAKKRLDEECANGTIEDIRYRAGYRDGVRAVLSAVKDMAAINDEGGGDHA